MIRLAARRFADSASRPQIAQMDADTPTPYPYAALTGRVIGLFYDVYNELGFGFLESVYQEAMCVALRDASLAFVSQPLLTVRFRGRAVGDFRPDLVVCSSIVVELKAARQLDPAHAAQVLNYLKATGLEVGLLLNFGARPVVRRYAFSRDAPMT